MEGMEIEDRDEDRVDDEEDMMTLAEFTHYRRRSKSPTPPDHNPDPMAVEDHLEGHVEEGSTSEKRVLRNRNEIKALARERANQLQSYLDPHYPSFVKCMVPSQVSMGFYMGLPSPFCKAYLPKQNVTVSLIGEIQKDFLVKYLAERTALTTGWKHFSLAHELVVGDALVFQLVKPTEFKVYIIRAYNMDEVDGVSGLLDLYAPQKEIKSGVPSKSEITEERCEVTLALPVLQQPGGNLKSNSEEFVPEHLEGIRLLETNIAFKDMTDRESFIVAVDGLVIDSELSEEERSKYYELCCSKKDFLHANLPAGINCKLAAGSISQTIHVANAIRSSKLSTTQDEFTAWDKKLEGLELLGMNVGFLRTRIKELVSFVLKSEEGMKFRKAVVEREDMKDNIRNLKEKLFELEEACKRLDTEIETLQVKAEHQELKLQAVLSAPW